MNDETDLLGNSQTATESLVEGANLRISFAFQTRYFLAHHSSNLFKVYHEIYLFYL